MLQRGVPNDPDRIVIDQFKTEQTEPSQQPPSVPVPPAPDRVIVTPVPTTAGPQGSLLSGAFRSLLPLALAAATGGLGSAALGYLFSPKITGPVTNDTTIVRPVQPAVKDGSLLQYLEDKGYHLPPEKRPK
jgi:hypothetical protein